MKRYKNEQQLVTAIDRAREKSKMLLIEAEKLEAHARGLRILVPWDEEAKECIRLAKAKRVSSRNLIDKRIPKLGHALAEIRTTTFPFAPDESVVVK